MNVAVLLVVNENGVPAPVPVELFGKKLNTIVPAFGVAPPPPGVNGSAVVFAIDIPVSNGGTTSASVTSMVVLAGTMFTTVNGPTSVSLNCGYPPTSVPSPNPLESRPVPTGNIVPVTLIDPGVVIAAPEARGAIATSTSKVSVLLVEVPVAFAFAMNEITAVLAADVTVVVVPVVPAVPPAESAPHAGFKLELLVLFPVFKVKFSDTPVGMLLNVSRIWVLFISVPAPLLPWLD